MHVWGYTLVSVLIVSLISLVGVFTLSLNKDLLKKVVLYLVSFAVGALFGDAVIHLIPEAFEEIPSKLLTSLLILAGVLVFFVLEKFLRWQHCHIPTSEEHSHPFVMLNLVGDSVHNMIDGMLIAASFMVSVPIGIATTLAVVLHEIPQEIGDLGIFVHGGMTVQRALFLNFMSALASFLGAFIVLVLGPHMAEHIVYLLPLTAGGFLYIAGSDLIPELHHGDDVNIKNSVGQFVCIILGIAVMAALLLLE